jgi:hypothetical protein
MQIVNKKGLLISCRTAPRSPFVKWGELFNHFIRFPRFEKREEYSMISLSSPPFEKGGQGGF